MERIVMTALWAVVCSFIVLGCLLVIAATWERRDSQRWRLLHGMIWLVCVASWSVWITAGQYPIFERNIALKIVWKALPLVGGTVLFLIVRRLVRQRQPGMYRG